MFDRCEEDLPNATSISYPPRQYHLILAHLIHSDLAQAALGALLSLTENPLTEPKEIITAAHFLPSTLLASASAAYTSSIQHYDGIVRIFH